MSDLNDLFNELNTAGTRFKSRKKDLMNQIGKSAANKVKKHTPVSSGALKESISHRAGQDSTEVYSTIDYAEPVDKGHVSRDGSFVVGKNMFEKGMMEAEADSDGLIEAFLEEFEI